MGGGASLLNRGSKKRWFRIHPSFSVVHLHVPRAWTGAIRASLLRRLQDCDGKVLISCIPPADLRARVVEESAQHVSTLTHGSSAGLKWSDIHKGMRLFAVNSTLVHSKKEVGKVFAESADLGIVLHFNMDVLTTEQRKIVAWCWTRFVKEQHFPPHEALIAAAREMECDADTLQLVEFVAQIVDNTRLSPNSICYILSHARGTKEARLKLMFAAIDRDGSGTIDHAEMVDAVHMLHCGDQASVGAGVGEFQIHRIVDDIMKRVDRDGNKVIDLSEFALSHDYLVARLFQTKTHIREGDTELHAATRRHETGIVAELLEQGVDADQTNVRGLTALGIAVSDDIVSPAVVGLLSRRSISDLPLQAQEFLSNTAEWTGMWRLHEGAELERAFAHSATMLEWNAEKARRGGELCIVAALCHTTQQLRLEFTDGKVLWWFPFAAVVRVTSPVAEEGAALSRRASSVALGHSHRSRRGSKSSLPLIQLGSHRASSRCSTLTPTPTAELPDLDTTTT